MHEKDINDSARAVYFQASFMVFIAFSRPFLQF